MPANGMNSYKMSSWLQNAGLRIKKAEGRGRQWQQAAGRSVVRFYLPKRFMIVAEVVFCFGSRLPLGRQARNFSQRGMLKQSRVLGTA